MPPRRSYSNTDLLGWTVSPPSVDLERLADALVQRILPALNAGRRSSKSLETSHFSLDVLLERLCNIESRLNEHLSRKKAAARGAVKGSRTREERAKSEAQRYFAEHPLSDQERDTMLSMVRAQRLRR